MKQLNQQLIFPLLAISLAMLISLFLGEGVIRMFVSPAYWTFRDASDDWQSDAQLGWAQKPNFNVTTYNGEFHWAVQFHTNQDGLLPFNTVRSRTPGVLRIMIFGDSAVAGRAVPEDERIHVKLQAQLRFRGIQAEVINAGVQGYSTDQELLSMQRLVPLYRPDVVLTAICENDFAANVVDVAYGISKPIFHVKDGRIAGLTLPDQRLLKVKRFDGPMLALVLQHSALYRFFQPQIFLLRSKIPFLRASNLTVPLPTNFYYAPAAQKEVPFEVFEVLLKEMKTTSEAYGAKFMFYAHPSLSEVWNPEIARTVKSVGLDSGAYDRYALDRRFEQISSRYYIDYCPMIDYFVKNQARGPFHLLPRDGHCNPQGYQLQAEVLAGYLSKKKDAAVTALGSPSAQRVKVQLGH